MWPERFHSAAPDSVSLQQDLELRVDLGRDRSRPEQRVDADVRAHLRDGELAGH